LVVGLDAVRIDGVGQREAAAERAVRTLYTQGVVLVQLLLELALPANGEDVVLHANVEILWIDIGEIRLDHQFVRGLVDVNSRRPGGQVGRLPGALESVVEQAIDLVLQGRSTAKSRKHCHDGATSIVRCEYV